MTDPLRSDPRSEGDAGNASSRDASREPERDPERDSERDKDARVEKLLLGGLDYYFAGQHELAISVWTRVLFLDRGHARAKAYIDRARGAIAERQREGEELLHTGVAAFDRGDAGTARQLLSSAVERVASEEAQALLERLDRLEQATVRSLPATAPAPRAETLPPVPLRPPDAAGSSRIVWVAIGVFAGLATAGVVAWIAVERPTWLPVTPNSPTPLIAQVSDPLPVPATSEVWLSRARRLYEDGRLRDALRALSAIGASDSRRPEADELKATIQRKLLEAARLPTSRPTTDTPSRSATDK
jgi:tetratricopeptide (TPR) repeat protein